MRDRRIFLATVAGLLAAPLAAAAQQEGNGYHIGWLGNAPAMTPPMVWALTQRVNTQVEAAFREGSRGIEHLKAEILRLEREAGNLVRFLTEGGLLDGQEALCAEVVAGSAITEVDSAPLRCGPRLVGRHLICVCGALTDHTGIRWG